MEDAARGNVNAVVRAAVVVKKEVFYDGERADRLYWPDGGDVV